MGLTIKSFRDILKGMVDWTTTNSAKLIDFNVGSATRTLYEAVASEVEQFYFNMYKNINYGIENAIFDSFGFQKIDAQEAFGTVTLSFYNPLPASLFIPSGTRFATVASGSSDTIYFSTKQDYVVDSGSVTADLEVYCSTPGTIGNVSADSIKLLVNPINYVSSVTNQSSFLTGKEAETQAERKQRFNQYIETLARGTIKSIEYGCKEVEGVAGVWVDDSTIGQVNVYAHDQNGDLPDSLKEKIIENLVNYRAAGIPVYVSSILKHSVDLTLTITVIQDYNTDTYKQSLMDNITGFLNAFPVARSFYLSDLIQFVMNLDDVAIVNCVISQPATDVIVPKQEIIRAGSINLTLTM